MLNKEDKKAIVQEFARHTGDTGSVEVQVALLTRDIQQLTEHCQQHKHDFSTKRGLLKMVCRRRSYLRYLERVDRERYKDLIGRLKLKK